MRRYAVRDGDTLVLSVDDAPWSTITFESAGFADPGAVTADDLAKAINASGTANASVRGEDLVIASPTRGGDSSVEVDTGASTAAGALGITDAARRVAGTGISPARLTSGNQEPFALPEGAVLRVVVDGAEHTIAFDAGVTFGNASASEIAGAIDAAVANVARASRDGRVILRSPGAGPDSRLAVEAAPEDEVDAAPILGFTGENASDQPAVAAPAELACAERSSILRAVNLTASPIELHLTTGTAVLPPRGELALLAIEAVHGPLQQLVDRGAVRLTASV